MHVCISVFFARKVLEDKGTKLVQLHVHVLISALPSFSHGVKFYCYFILSHEHVVHKIIGMAVW